MQLDARKVNFFVTVGRCVYAYIYKKYMPTHICTHIYAYIHIHIYLDELLIDNNNEKETCIFFSFLLFINKMKM